MNIFLILFIFRNRKKWCLQICHDIFLLLCCVTTADVRAWKDVLLFFFTRAIVCEIHYKCNNFLSLSAFEHENNKHAIKFDENRPAAAHTRPRSIENVCWCKFLINFPTWRSSNGKSVSKIHQNRGRQKAINLQLVEKVSPRPSERVNEWMIAKPKHGQLLRSITNILDKN